MDEILLNGHDITFVNLIIFKMVPGVNPFENKDK